MPGSILKYRKKLSGPLLDRIDLHVHVPPVDEAKLTSYGNNETSLSIQNRVIQARERQQKRFYPSQSKVNSFMSIVDIKTFCKFEDKATDLLKQAIAKLSLSARSYFKIIKIAQTIADLNGKEMILVSHVAEALQYRPQEE